MRGQHGPTFGYGLGFQTPEFLSIVVSIQVQQSATPLQIGRRKTLRQAPAQLVTRCRCFGMWRRQAALALNGTAGVQASGKGPSSYTAQLPTPTGRSVQQGVSAPNSLPESSTYDRIRRLNFLSNCKFYLALILNV